MREINVSIPASLKAALDAEIAKTEASVSSIVTSSLARFFGTTVHTLFQVSTSGALVAGIYEGAVSAGVILRHGDFGLGTFENLDGEMVVLDGHVYRVRWTGKVSEAAQDALAPFAVVTRFAPQVDLELAPTDSLAALTGRCDDHRQSNNIFYGFRLDGYFHHVRTRAVSPPAGHGRLVDAAKAQAEFERPGGSGEYAEAFGATGLMIRIIIRVHVDYRDNINLFKTVATMPSIKLGIEKGSQFASFEGPEAPKAESMTIDHANGNPCRSSEDGQTVRRHR